MRENKKMLKLELEAYHSEIREEQEEFIEAFNYLKNKGIVNTLSLLYHPDPIPSKEILTAYESHRSLDK
jgi:hypothetical protein